MPYQQGSRLPGERASKIGHIDVINSPLVKKLCENFSDPKYDNTVPSKIGWNKNPEGADEFKLVFSSDGSIQVIEQNTPPYKAIAFVKTALLKIDQHAIDKIDRVTPHPLAIRDLLKDSALFHSTAFPLRNVSVAGKTTYNAIREIIYESTKDIGLNNSLDGAMMETLKWIAYEKWSPNPKGELEKFGCPHCDDNVATLPFDKEEGSCPVCKKKIFITDMLGLHLNMADNFAPDQVASDYMSFSETLMIFTPIRYYWESNKEILSKCLFVKDGPLSLRATLAKLTAPIHRFFNYAATNGTPIAMIGQEKSGIFFDHLQLIGKEAPVNSYFIPDDNYIRENIQHTKRTSMYGWDTNYGAKLFIKQNEYHKMVLCIPTGQKGNFVNDPSSEHLIAFKNIIATLPMILSNRFEGALLPIELANKIASLSTYPSAKTLELFADSKKKV